MDCSTSSNTKTHFLSSLLVFNNTINRELIRSLHVYRSANGNEDEVEREFVFKANGPYVEMEAQPVLTHKSLNFGVSSPLVSQGFVDGLWACAFAFHSSHLPSNIPSFLNLSRNPKLKSIPSLANDLQAISELISATDCREKETEQVCLGEGTCQGNTESQSPLRRSSPVLDQDLNCLPYSVTMSDSSDDQQIEQSLSGSTEKKKTRATSKDLARIALSDLAKYFNLPIVEASRNLKVGLTALKRKCREFGIPRWPHRKIKSLDSLIHDLQEERKWQEEGNKAAETAVAKRQKMLESEKESIERKPFLEMKSETKRFRQDVFKRRHRARVLSSMSQATSSSSSSSSSISGN